MGAPLDAPPPHVCLAQSSPLTSHWQPFPSPLLFGVLVVLTRVGRGMKGRTQRSPLIGRVRLSRRTEGIALAKGIVRPTNESAIARLVRSVRNRFIHRLTHERRHQTLRLGGGVP